MIKYVAYIDVLGFKDKVDKSTQQQAGKIITDFSQLVYSEWGKLGNENDPSLNGLVVSDCVIVYTNNCNPQALERLLKFLIN